MILVWKLIYQVIHGIMHWLLLLCYNRGFFQVFKYQTFYSCAVCYLVLHVILHIRDMVFYIRSSTSSMLWSYLIRPGNANMTFRRAERIVIYRTSIRPYNLTSGIVVIQTFRKFVSLPFIAIWALQTKVL